MKCYDVALWRGFPALFPEYVALVKAKSAFAAVEWLMRSCGLDRVAYASARVLDGSLIYRVFKVWAFSEAELVA